MRDVTAVRSQLMAPVPRVAHLIGTAAFGVIHGRLAAAGVVVVARDVPPAVNPRRPHRRAGIVASAGDIGMLAVFAVVLVRLSIAVFSAGEQWDRAPEAPRQGGGRPQS